VIPKTNFILIKNGLRCYLECELIVPKFQSNRHQYWVIF